jgi:hypothetical protein
MDINLYTRPFRMLPWNVVGVSIAAILAAFRLQLYLSPDAADDSSSRSHQV